MIKNIAIMGFGNVGFGVAELCRKNNRLMFERTGLDIRVKYILDRRDFPQSSYKDKLTKDFDVIAKDDSIALVVEAMGGVSPAFEFSMTCLSAGKHVVTSNKELVAQKGAKLIAAAKKNNVNYMFEGSVGGTIPIIRPLHQCLVSNEFLAIAGILNGTTNFILTRMIEDGMEFKEALAKAQELGYAEADPTADVEGIDACRKICILASLAFGAHVYPDSVHAEGISRITLEDVAYADSENSVIKLIGQTHKTESGKIFALVSPAMISRKSQLANINDVFNGILVRGDACDDVLFYGRGAGKLPTASAIMGDAVQCLLSGDTIRTLHWEDSAGDNVADYLTHPSSMYIRCLAKSRNQGGIAISKHFGAVRFLLRDAQPENEIAFITPKIPEALIEKNLEELQEQGVELLSTIRVLDY